MLKVLIVDDEQIVRVYLKSMINWEQYGITIIGTCKNGEEALQFIENNRPDIIFTDLKMPKMNGIELIEAVKQKYNHIKILVLSNHDDYDLVRKAMKRGAEDYYLKIALQPEDLLNAVTNIKSKIEEENKIKTTQQIEKENNLENYYLARRSFLTTLFRGDIYYSEMELSTYVKKYELFQTDMFVYQLYWNTPNNDRHLTYLDSILYEVFDIVKLDIIHLSQSKTLVLMYPMPNISSDQLTQLWLRALKNVNSYLNCSVELSDVMIIRNMQQFIQCAKNLSQIQPIVTQEKQEEFISEEVAANYRQEIRAVLRYIHEHYHERITLQDLAYYVNLNEAYLSRLFKSETGKTLNHYLNEFRIYQAKLLLKEPDLMVKEVAQLVGIKDQLYFNRVFKKFYGSSPSEYKESLKVEGEKRA